VLGTFVPPFAVLNDRRFLESLGRRDTIAGMAEAVEVALIRDAEFFTWLEAHAPELADCAGDAVGELIRRAAGLHLEHIATSGDPFEMGSARPLDFGHWAAHRLESLTRNRLRHGEAVAIGIALDTLYSRAAGLVPAAVVERILDLLEGLGLPRWDEALI
jgi:3-dehydroquinate synthase